MQVKKALARLIEDKTRKGEVICLTKIKHQIGKIEMTIGAYTPAVPSRKQYAIYENTKTCKCGELSFTSNDPYEVAQYLIDLCERDFLKQNLPLYRYC